MTVALPALRPAVWAATLAAGLSGCTIYRDCPVVYEPAAVVVDQPPPKVWEPVGDVPTKPAADAVWVDGHYDWDNGQQRWVWIDGHWETGRAGQSWTEPRAVRTQGGYEYHPGYWRPAEAEPSGVYRRESDVRLSARASASASVRVGGGSGTTSDGAGRGDAARRQSGDVESRPRGGATSGGTTAGGGNGQVRVRGVSDARTDGNGQNGGGTGATRGSGRGTVNPGTRADAPARTGGGTTTTTANPAGTRPAGGTTTATTANPAGASGRGTGTTTTTTDPAGASGGTDAPVVRNVASGPIRCTLENRLTVRNGAIEATLENVVTRPQFMAGEPLVLTARQGDGWERVRLRVPLEPGTWDVRVSTSDGRSADCGFLRVLGP